MITTDKLQSILKKDLEDTVEAEIVAAAKKGGELCLVDVTDIHETLVMRVIGELRDGGFTVTMEETTEEPQSGRTWLHIRWSLLP